MAEVLINEASVEWRFNNVSGPKYLLRGPNIDFGLILLLPGEDLATHYHNIVEEDFYTLEGEANVYIKEEMTHLRPGDLLHIPAKTPHYLKNNGTHPWKAVIIKAPFDPKDKIDVDWTVGQPFDESQIK